MRTNMCICIYVCVYIYIHICEVALQLSHHPIFWPKNCQEVGFSVAIVLASFDLDLDIVPYGEPF